MEDSEAQREIELFANRNPAVAVQRLRMIFDSLMLNASSCGVQTGCRRQFGLEKRKLSPQRHVTALMFWSEQSINHPKKKSYSPIMYTMVDFTLDHNY